MRKFSMSLSTRILIGMGLGIACGIFFGERCSFLSIIGDGFIKLLQMTIVPYIVVSLINGIGGLKYEQAKRLAARGGAVFLIFAVLGVGLVFVTSLGMPPREGGSFFSASDVTPPEAVNYLDQYIPWNPFYAMANTIIPAVVLFSVLVGVGLIGVEKKDRILEPLGILTEVLTRITNWVVDLTPFGVFAISANAAGILTLEQVSSLQVYFVLFTLTSLLASFLVLPVIATTFTPFRYRDIVSVSWDAMITGFTTANLFVVMPVVNKGLKRLYEKYGYTDGNLQSSTEIAIPIYFNLPDTGKLLNLLFVLFAGWFVGSPVSLSEYPGFGFGGFISFLGSLNLGIPYLLKEYHISSDLFSLFIAAGVFTGRFTTLMAAMDMLVFSLLCGCAMTGLLRTSARKVLVRGVAVCVVFLFVILVARVVFQKTVTTSNAALERLQSMSLDSEVESRVFAKPPPPPQSKRERNLSVLERIRARGALRVGFHPDSMPFAYFNKQGEDGGKGDLVGFDVAMAHKLAADLGCKLQFYPTVFSDGVAELENGSIDIVMSSVAMSARLLRKWSASSPYMEAELALVVPDYEKDLFKSRSDLLRLRNFTVAAVQACPFLEVFRKAVPNARIKIVGRHLDFFEGRTDADAMLLSAKSGSAWALRYPQYAMVVPQPLLDKTYYAYPVAEGAQDFLDFLNSWLELQRVNGTIDSEYAYWILGEETRDKKPRWSVVADVLHWAGEPDEAGKEIDLEKEAQKAKRLQKLKNLELGPSKEQESSQ